MLYINAIKKNARSTLPNNGLHQYQLKYTPERASRALNTKKRLPRPQTMQFRINKKILNKIVVHISVSSIGKICCISSSNNTIVIITNNIIVIKIFTNKTSYVSMPQIQEKNIARQYNLQSKASQYKICVQHTEKNIPQKIPQYRRKKIQKYPSTVNILYRSLLLKRNLQ